MSTGLPVTIWSPSPPGSGELTNVGVNDIVDPSGNQLVDPSTNDIVDTGIQFNQTPVTIWNEDDSK